MIVMALGEYILAVVIFTLKCRGIICLLNAEVINLLLYSMEYYLNYLLLLLLQSRVKYMYHNALICSISNTCFSLHFSGNSCNISHSAMDCLLVDGPGVPV